MTTAIEQTVETYGIENWGAGYFDVNRKGNLIVRPAEGDPRSADLREIIEDLSRRGISTPILLRFPSTGRRPGAKAATRVQQINSRIRVPGRAHVRLSDEGQSTARGRRGVSARRLALRLWLEAGSKAELYAALALEQSPDSLLVLNGFKDEEFIELAFASAKSGKHVVIVIEKLSELDHILRIAEEPRRQHRR